MRGWRRGWRFWIFGIKATLLEIYLLWKVSWTYSRTQFCTPCEFGAALLTQLLKQSHKSQCTHIHSVSPHMIVPRRKEKKSKMRLYGMTLSHACRHLIVKRVLWACSLCLSSELVEQPLFYSGHLSCIFTVYVPWSLVLRCSDRRAPLVSISNTINQPC